MVRKTRKAKTAAGKAMSVPQLRRAFEHIDKFVAKKGTDVDAFRKEWKKTFGKEVSKAAAEDYLKFVKSKKSKSQSGGGALTLSPASIGYDMRAGTDTPYGSFNKYVGDGFGFANADSVAAACGRENITPKLPADLGSNKVGGGRRKTRKAQKGGAFSLAQFLSSGAEALQRPVTMGSVLSPNTAGTLYTTQMMAKGYPTGTAGVFNSPRPEIPAFNYPSPGTSYAAYVSPSSRLV
jgi:hypothetical protein